MSDPRIVVALDVDSRQAALTLARQLDPTLCRVKVGKELYVAEGPRLVQELMADGFEVFLDLKFHDIPNTVAGACKAAAALGVWMVNVHALGGRAMLAAAADALSGIRQPPLLVAVTVLTSLGPADLAEIGIAGSPEEAALRLATLAKRCGLDGVVCSPLEAARLRSELGRDFRLVTPGVRPTPRADDQTRVATPRGALSAGADYLVIGRPITRAPDPRAALLAIHREIHA
ncbi:MAG: orotidine-5'-phosphate decarboxylase [Azospira oryzae]|nr:MAG: orotidine-5'-phosphate decarboxylase [Azospira oryzae]PZP81807.1 MAG: orotidine-5'-phosphate decarboxylase [Azospira oryzae]